MNLKHLEQVLETPYLGIVSFVRHGDKTKEGQLSEKGKEQARKLGQKFKQIHKEGKVFLRSSSSDMDRANDTVKEIFSAEPKYNKPISKNMQVEPYFSNEIMEKYVKIMKEESEVAGFDWFLNSSHGKDLAKHFSYILSSASQDAKKITKKDLNFHYIHGTHEALPEALLKRVLIIKEGKSGFDSIDDIGGGLKLAEPINFILGIDNKYKVEMRNKTYNVDMKALNDLASQYTE